MAIKDFEVHDSVIILSESEGDKSAEDIRARLQIKNGDNATPQLFNDRIDDSLNRDINLENALTYLARAASMYTTSNTKFLCHCEGEGKDIIKYRAPQSYTGSASDIFVDDDTFLGAAYPTGSAQNMISGRASSTVHSEKPYISSNGWSCELSGLSKGYSVGVDDTQEGYTRVTNAGYTKVAGYVTFKTDKFRIIGDDLVTLPKKVSFGCTINATNPYLCKTEISLELHLFDQATGTEVKTVNDIIIPNTYNGEFNGVLKKEAIEVPQTVGSTTIENMLAQIKVIIHLPESSANLQESTIDISKFMLQEGEILSVYTKDSREAAYCQYNNVIDLNESLDTTLSFWAKWSDYATKNFGIIGPIFLSFDDELTIGLVSTQVTDTLFRLKLVGYSGNTALINTTDTIDIPTEYFNYYLFHALRVEEYQEDTDQLHIVASVVVGNEVKVLNGYVKKSDVPKQSDGTQYRYGDIIVGNARELGSTYTTLTKIFSSKISEIRYDQEWINNIEMYIMSLGRKPFSYKQSTDSQIVTKDKTATEVIDSAGINLLQNPTARWSTMNWTAYPSDSAHFEAKHTDTKLGNSFHAYSSGISNDIIIYSKPITVTPRKLYHLRSVMCSDISSGEVGIGVRFYSDSETFDPSTGIKDTDILSSLTLSNSTPTYYACHHTTESTETKATVFMYIKKSAVASVGWSKLKFEQGYSATFFTDDTGPDYAVYA